MSTVFDPAGIIVFVLMLIGFSRAARTCALGALSLPCIALLTGLLYFYLMPLFWLIGSDRSFFGLVLDDLDLTHRAVGLYALGALAAFIVGRRVLARDPLQPAESERAINPLIFWGILALAMAGVAAKVAIGLLNFGGTAATAGAQTANVNFLQLSDSLLIAITIVFLVRNRFGSYSLALLGFTTLIFLTDGFRFRLVILFSAVVIAFALTRHIRIRTLYVAVGSVVGVTLLNAIGLSRRYGAGLDLSRLQGTTWADLFQSFGAEIGPTFVLTHLTRDPPPVLIGFDPWIIALSRLIPSFLWEDKPYPTYLQYYARGFPDPHAMSAGIAGTQQAEFFLQFGWIGLPVLAALFYGTALLIQHRTRFLSFEGRVAGAAIVPALFGFYAQQRGYTFQIVCEIIFTLSPLFVMHLGTTRTVTPPQTPTPTPPLGPEDPGIVPSLASPAQYPRSRA